MSQVHLVKNAITPSTIYPISSIPKFKIYNQRWLVLLSFCLFSFTNAFAFVQNAPILFISSLYYRVDDEAIVWFSNVYYVTYICFAIFSIKPLQKRLDISLIIASLISATGGWIKYFGKQNYYYALIGYIIISIGQLPIIASPVYISEKWFPVSERTLSTSIGSFVSQLGMNFGFIFAVVKFDNVSDLNKIIQCQESMNMIYAIFNTVAFIMCLGFIKDRPKTPPSLTSDMKKFSLKTTIKIMMSQKKSILDLLALSLFLGFSWTYISVISLILDPFGYTQFEIGFIGLIFNLSGTLGGTTASIIIDYQISHGQKPKYDLLIRTFITIGIFSMIVQAAFLDQANLKLVFITTTFIGVGLNSYFPIAAQSYVETMYPCFELVLITFIMIGSNVKIPQILKIKLFGLIGNYLLLIPQLQKYGLWVLIGIMSPFYLFLIIFFKTKLKRSDIEKQQSNLSEE